MAAAEVGETAVGEVEMSSRAVSLQSTVRGVDEAVVRNGDLSTFLSSSRISFGRRRGSSVRSRTHVYVTIFFFFTECNVSSLSLRVHARKLNKISQIGKRLNQMGDAKKERKKGG